jgi:transcriptional regulator with XRE-family HTH domain
MPVTLRAMILRELLSAHGIDTIKEFSDRGKLSKSHAWNLWHGRSRLGLNLAKALSGNLGIPLAELTTLDPTPITPPRGRGGPRHYRPSTDDPPAP